MLLVGKKLLAHPGSITIIHVFPQSLFIHSYSYLLKQILPCWFAHTKQNGFA